MRSLYVPFVLCVVSILFPVLTFSHGSGASFEQSVGEYTIDIGYEPAEPQAGERIVFDLGRLLVGEEEADFDYVWVRLEQERESLLAAGIVKADVGPTSLLYQIPADMSGEMTVHVRYQKGEEMLADTSFPLEVATSNEPLEGRLLLVGGTALILGVVAGIFIRRRTTVRT